LNVVSLVQKIHKTKHPFNMRKQLRLEDLEINQLYLDNNGMIWKFKGMKNGEMKDTVFEIVITDISIAHQFHKSEEFIFDKKLKFYGGEGITIISKYTSLKDKIDLL
jgi:hypothetical protein